MNTPAGIQPPGTDIAATLQQAYAFWNAGNAHQAEIACRQVLGAWPGQSDASHLMGLMAHAQGNTGLAIDYLRTACQAPQAPAIYYSNLAEMCRQNGLLAEAEDMGHRAVALDPLMGGAWNNLGIILQEMNKLEESRQCLERALALEPENPQAHNNLGNTCKRLGLMEAAEHHWTQAIALRPDYADVYSNLANLLTERNEFVRARAAAERAIALNPRLADAYINLAGVESAAHAYHAALRPLRTLLDFAPGHVGALAALAQTLKELNDLGAAVQAAGRAVALAPLNAEAHNALGIVLQAQDEQEAAAAAFARAAELPGTMREQALINQANLHVEFGRIDTAEALFAHILTEFPRSVPACFGLANLRRRPPDDPVIDRMRILLETDRTLSPNNLTRLHFGLGKALLDAGDSEQAFRHLNEGNRLKRATIGYDADGVTRWMREIAAAYPAASSGVVPPPARTGVQPVFVLGMPRSGTTLIEQILASHPSVHGAGELVYMQRAVDEAEPFPAAAAGLSADRLAAAGAAYLDQVGSLANGKPFVIDKMPSNFLYIGLIRQILPHARIIHCRRDPVDTCLSCYSQLFGGEQTFTYDQTELGRFYRDYDVLMQHWRSFLPAEDFIEVEYEAVVDDYEREARRLVAFLGLPWDDACLSFHRTERAIRTASVTQVRQPIYRHAARRWRRHAAQLQPLLTALGL